MSRYIYALHDSDKELKKQGAFCISPSEAKKYNDLGYGIFQTIQSFNSNKRTSDNLNKILSFAIDIDEGTKENQIKRICLVNVEPSTIIESKSGFHVYFNLKGEAKKNLYTSFIEEYLIPLYDACEGAKDLSRILRVPGFYHCKDPNNKFMIKKIYSSSVTYSEEKLFEIFYEKYDFLKKKLLLYRDNDIKTYKDIPKGTLNKTAEEIAFAIGKPRKSRNGYHVRCPAHFDTDPSLFITQKSDKVLFKCFGGCPQERVLKALKEKNLW